MKTIDINMENQLNYQLELPVEKLKESGLYWFATGRFGLDLILQRPLSEIDIFSVYVSEDQLEDWKLYLQSIGAKRLNEEDKSNANLRVIPTNDYEILLEALRDYKNNDANLLELLSRYVNEARSSIKKIDNEKRKHKRFNEFAKELEESKSPNYLFSLDGKLPNLISLKRLGEDIVRSAPRYWDNIQANLEEHIKAIPK